MIEGMRAMVSKPQPETLKASDWFAESGSDYIDFQAALDDPHQAQELYTIDTRLVRLNLSSWPAQSWRLEKEEEPFVRTESGGVEFDAAKMELYRPYPFQIDGVWLVAAKHDKAEDDIRIYQLK